MHFNFMFVALNQCGRKLSSQYPRKDPA